MSVQCSPHARVLRERGRAREKQNDNGMLNLGRSLFSCCCCRCHVVVAGIVVPVAINYAYKVWLPVFLPLSMQGSFLVCFATDPTVIALV